MNKNKMEPMKVYVPHKIHQDMKVLSLRSGKTMSHIVSEILYQYLKMAPVRAPKVPPEVLERLMKDEPEYHPPLENKRMPKNIHPTMPR